jgi:hypothetical protein
MLRPAPGLEARAPHPGESFATGSRVLPSNQLAGFKPAVRHLCYSAKCWSLEGLKPVEEFFLALFLVVSAERLTLLPLPVFLWDYTLVSLCP